MALLPATGAAYNGGPDDRACATISGVVGVVDVDPWITFDGVRCLRLNTNNAGAKCTLFADETQLEVSHKVFGFTALLGLSALPTTPIPLLYHTTSSIARGGEAYVRVMTDGTVGIFDRNGNELARTSSALSTSALRSVTVVFDMLNAATVAAFVAVDGTWEVAVDTGLAPGDMFNIGSGRIFCFGPYLDSGINCGAALYIRNAVFYRSTSAADSPYLAQLPDMRVSDSVWGDSTGTYMEWDDSLGGPVDYTQVDDSELPAHDGDGSFWQAATNGLRALVKSSAANPVPSGATIINVCPRAVSRVVAGGKTPYRWFFRISGNDQSYNGHLAGVSTSHAGTAYPFLLATKPGGGSWSRNDFDPNTLEWGAISAPAPSTVSDRITLLPSPMVVYYTELLDLAPEPAPNEQLGSAAASGHGDAEASATGHQTASASGSGAAAVSAAASGHQAASAAASGTGTAIASASAIQGITAACEGAGSAACAATGHQTCMGGAAGTAAAGAGATGHQVASAAASGTATATAVSRVPVETPAREVRPPGPRITAGRPLRARVRARATVALVASPGMGMPSRVSAAVVVEADAAARVQAVAPAVVVTRIGVRVAAGAALARPSRMRAVAAVAMRGAVTVYDDALARRLLGLPGGSMHGED